MTMYPKIRTDVANRPGIDIAKNRGVLFFGEDVDDMIHRPISPGDDEILVFAAGFPGKFHSLFHRGGLMGNEFLKAQRKTGLDFCDVAKDLASPRRV